MKGFLPELHASSREGKPATHRLGKKERNGVLSMKYAMVLMVALGIAIGFLVASTSVDHILLEKLFIASTIVFSTVALKAASTWKDPVK